nr:5756_t:CDS:2 [Entrophospora candida]
MSDTPIKAEEKNNDNTIIQESEENANKDSKIVEEESIKQDDNDKKSATTATITTSGDTATAKKNATVESGEDSDLDDDDMPELAEEQGVLPPDISSLNFENILGGGGSGGSAKNQTRGEKKARKAMQKLGLVPVPGITRVTIKRAKNAEDLNSQAQANAAQQFQNSAETTTAAATSKEIAKVEESIEEDSTAIDETNVEAKDIELVMQQTVSIEIRSSKGRRGLGMNCEVGKL